MADSEGMDAMSESIFNGVIEYLLEKGKTRDVLMYVLQANFGIRHSDLIKLKLINLIDIDGNFRDKVNWCEQKTSKTRQYIINDAVKAATIIYLRSHTDKKLTDFLFTAEGRNKGYKKVTYKDENGKVKALRQNGKFVYERDENGNLIPEPLRRDQAENTLKDALIAIGVKLKNDRRCKDGEYKLNTHSNRKFYSEKFSEVAYTLKAEGKLNVDADVLALVQLDLRHSSMQTTMRYNHSFDRIKEVVCQNMNIGLSVLERYL
jgi:integrase